MQFRVLYMGDTDIDRHASHLAGVMSYYDIDYNYIPSSGKVTVSDVDGCDAYILSDYPASAITPEVFAAIKQKVKSGAGFLMIGGWESFNSVYGQYKGTLLEDIIPVEMADEDDRLNSASPLFLRQVS